MTNIISKLNEKTTSIKRNIKEDFELEICVMNVEIVRK